MHRATSTRTAILLAAGLAALPARAAPRLPPAPAGDPGFSSEHFAGPGHCTLCHDRLSDAAGKDVSIVADWSATPMANAARDPIWRAKVRSELGRTPKAAGVIEEKCSRCHAPMASFEARSHGEGVQVLDAGFLATAHPRHDAALGGVGCTLCHQIQDSAELGTLAGFTGGYRVGDDHVLYGPFEEPFQRPMRMHTDFTPAHSPHVRASKLCATCHNLKTPTVSEDGTVLSPSPEREFPEQMAYTEWEHSAYAGATPASCQDCHMPRARGVAVSRMPPWLPRRDGFAVHELVGANRLLLDLLGAHPQQLGVLSETVPAKLARAGAMLASAGTVKASGVRLSKDGLAFTLRIASATGHKLPTGFPSRRVVLHVTVRDAKGRVVFESGRVNADGSVEGADADRDPAAVEPHHEVITEPGQVQIYEAVMGDPTGKATQTLLRAAAYLKDNRLLPAGFDKSTAPADVRVVGGALSDGDFVGGSDEVHFRLAGLTGARYRIEAELVHQPLSYAFARDLFADGTAEAADLEAMFRASGAKSSRIAAVSFAAAR